MDTSGRKGSTKQHKLQLIIGGLQSMDNQGATHRHEPVVSVEQSRPTVEALSGTPSILTLTPPRLGQGLPIS